MPYKSGKLDRTKNHYRKLLQKKKLEKLEKQKKGDQEICDDKQDHSKDCGKHVQRICPQVTTDSTQHICSLTEMDTNITSFDCDVIKHKITELVNNEVGWCCTYIEKGDGITIHKVVSGLDKQPVISRGLLIYENLTWAIVIHGKMVSRELPQLIGYPSRIKDLQTVFDLFSCLRNVEVCAGNYEEEYTSLVEYKGGVIGAGVAAMSFSHEHHVSAYKEPYFGGVSKNGVEYNSSVRSANCQFFTEKQKTRCVNCTKHRDSLRKLVSRRRSRDLNSTDRTMHNSKVNYRYLNRTELTERTRNIQSANDKLRVQLRRYIQEGIEVNGVHLDKSATKDFCGLMRESNTHVLSQFPEGSFKRIFWEEQCKANNTDNPCGIRWHPTIIRWCLALKLQSSSGYEALRSSGFVSLPSQRTLRDYTNYIKPQVGVNHCVLEELVSEYDVKSLPEHKRYVVLLHDEMKLKSQLVYDKTTEELIGYVNLGDINQELGEFEKTCIEQNGVHTTKPALATHILALMVRGVATDMKYCVSYYPSNGCTSDELFAIIWENISFLEVGCGLKVVASTSDGASPNRRFYKLHRTPNMPADFIIHKAPNMFSDTKRCIYFFSDVPHLVKTSRNCWANSEAHANTRSLWNNGQPILWKHLSDLVNRDHERPIHLLNKLGWEHIHLTSFSIMRVNLAAQVLSETVANAIELYGPPDAGGTVKFVRMMDRFFDCLNVRNTSEHQRKRKPHLAPYRHATDPRLEWLDNDFLSYLSNWRESTQMRPGNFTRKQRNAMCLSHQTLVGLTMSVKSFVEVCKFLLSEGIEFVLSERFCQDSLEQHFSKHRQKGGANNDPTVRQFGYQENVIRLQRSHQIQCMTGNTGRTNVINTVENVVDLPLPKRQKK